MHVNLGVGRVVNKHILIGLLSAGLFLLGYIFIPASTNAVNDYVVSISADGMNRTVRTTGGTVGELLNKTGIVLNEYDLVEPSPDTPIKGPVFNINVYRARPITIDDEGKTFVVMSPYSSARLIAEHADLQVYQEDIVKLTRVDDFLQAGLVGEKLSINRATPVTINLYGNIIEVRTHVTTVGDLLKQKEIVPDEEDVVSPSLDTLIKQDMVIGVTRVGVEVVTEEEIVEFETETIWDDNISLGSRTIEQPGVNGLRIVTYEVEYHNDEEVSRSELRSVVSQEPTIQIVRAGTKVVAATDNVSLGQELAEQRGWGGEQWTCLYKLWYKESRWDNLAQNPYSTAFGIPQFLDGSWAATGYQKSSDPATQIQAGFVYIQNRYGTPCGAWQHSVDTGWY